MYATPQFPIEALLHASFIVFKHKHNFVHFGFYSKIGLESLQIVFV